MSFPITLLRDPAPEGIDAELTSRDQRRTERWLLGGEAKKIRCHAHLAITVVARPNPDHRDPQVMAHTSCQCSGDVFQNDGETAGCFQC